MLNRGENIVAKGEIAHLHYEQFHLLSQCFQSSSEAEAP